MTEAEALTAARRILGIRVKVYREEGDCVVARVEYSTAMVAGLRVYGRAKDWKTAVSRAQQGYDDMKAAARKGKR